MKNVKHNKQLDFHEPVPELIWILLLGITTIAGIWLLIGMIKMLFLML